MFWFAANQVLVAWANVIGRVLCVASLHVAETIDATTLGRGLCLIDPLTRSVIWRGRSPCPDGVGSLSVECGWSREPETLEISAHLTLR